MSTTTISRVVSALIRSSHPVPSLVVTVLTTAFAWAVGLSWWQVGVVAIAMLSNQMGIGLGNDWLDAAKDTRAGRVDKPLATGTVSLATARTTAISLGVIALALSALLGVWALVCQMVMLFAGWWYNAHAKGHWSSPACYLLGFSLLPVFPSLALNPPELPIWWVVVVAGLLGVSAHFANALPDLLSDKQTGVRGLPQRVGAKRSGLVLATGVVAATLLITAFGESLPLSVRVLTAALAVSAGLSAAVLAFSPTPPRIIFPLVMGSAAVSALAIVLDMAAR